MSVENNGVISADSIPLVENNQNPPSATSTVEVGRNEHGRI